MNRREFIKSSFLSSLMLGSRRDVQANSLGQKGIEGYSESKVGINRSLGSNKPLNILMIVTDQERARHLLPEELSLPAKDRLIASGVTFENAQVVTSLCSMSRGTIYTGQHQQFNRMWENSPLPYASELSRHTPTLGHMFTQLGYRTAYFGKWHLSKLPSGRSVGERTMKELLASYGFQYSDQDREIDGPLEGHIWDPATISATQKFIRQQHGDQPWFAAVNLVNPHDIMFFQTHEAQTASRWSQFPHPITPAPENELYAQKHNFPLLQNFGLENWQERPYAHQIYASTFEGVVGIIDFNNEKLWQIYQDYYFNCLQDVDAQLQKLIDTLDETKAWEDTLVIYTSDHGEMLGAHRLRDKGPMIYQDCNNVPMIVVHPEGQRGETTKALTSHVDIAPTLLDFSGLDKAETKKMFPDLCGHSFAGQVFDVEEATTRETCLYQWSSLVYIDDEFSKVVAPMLEKDNSRSFLNFFMNGKMSPRMKNRAHFRACFDGRYKFARYFSPTKHRQHYSYQLLIEECDLELYDTLEDPFELNNLASSRNLMIAIQHDELKELIVEQNKKLEALISDEIGEDLGAFLPGPTFIWAA